MFEQEIEHLNSSSLKLNQLFYTPSKVDKNALNSLLDELNSLQYRFYFMQNQKPDKVILIINQLCTLISTQDHFLVAKHCQLIHQVISTQHIVLTDATLKITLQWCLQSFTSSPTISIVDILLALNTLVSAHVTSPVVNSVSGVLFDTLIQSTTDSCMENNDIFLFCMKCLNSLIPHLSTTKLDLLGSQILNHLSCLHPCSHFLLITLRTVCQYHSVEWITSHLGILMSTVLAYAKYDLPGYAFSKPKPIFPSPGFQLELSIDASSNAPGTKAVSSFKTRAKNKKKNKDKEDEEVVIVSASPCNTQSDSEYSDSEISRLKKINAGVRLTCFKLLSSILEKVNKKLVFGYISTLVLGSEALPNCLLIETSAKCRVAILGALIQIFTYSKPFLALAQIEGKTDRSSFVSFASLLTDVIVCVHEKVLLCLHQEQYASVLIHLLKCIDTLAINSPYEKLRTNFSDKLTEAVFPFLSHRDANITVVALTCFSDMISLCSDDILVKLCHLVLLKLQSEDTLIPVLVECWQLLSVVAKLRVVVLLDHHDLWSGLVRMMDEHLSKGRGSNLVQLHTVIAAQHLCQNLHLSDRGSQHCDQLWFHLMEKNYFISLQDKAESPALLTAICDCLATMNPATYDKLEGSYQRTCLVILLGHCSHEESMVRAAAVRALAIYSAFEHEDPVFIADVADSLVRCVHDAVPLVRCKAAWSLGNLSDTLVSHPEAGSDVHLLSLLQACIHCCEDSEKIRSNAVRPLGIYLKLLNKDQVTEEKYRDAIGKSVQLLTRLARSGTNMKIKWNACYALGHILCNSSIMQLPQSVEWCASIWSCLIDLLPSVGNFKVKISICHTLSSLDSREHYEPFFLAILSAVLSSFDVVRTHTYDVHIAGLKVTLYKTLCHFLLLLNPVDLTSKKLVDDLRARADEVSSVGESERGEVDGWRQKCREKIEMMSNGRSSESLSLLQRMFSDEESLDGG